MKSFKETSNLYFPRFGYENHPLIENKPDAQLKLSIVIPSYHEDLETTLDSLSQCALVEPQAVEIIIVLNHSADASDELIGFHRSQYRELLERVLDNGVPVYPMLQGKLPKKHAGVGLARKIGMDEALFRFSEINQDGLIVCLDGDCEVSQNYLEELLKAESRNVNGLSISFEHTLVENDPSGAITYYELFLRYYIQALRSSGYPNAFHTIGSSMAIKASKYAEIGGMNRRKAGEDFYFLHKLIPQGKFFDLTTCSVFPSARESERVPFGTGRAMMESRKGEKDFTQVYNPIIFNELKKFHQGIMDYYHSGNATVSGSVDDFLKSTSLLEGLESLRARSKTQKQFIRNFGFWWDGFKVLKYVHHARDCFYPNIGIGKASRELFGLNRNEPLDLLVSYMDMDKNSPFCIFDGSET